MITAYITFDGITIRNNFDLLSDALIFARSQEVGTTFVIREEETLLAKGRIEEYKEYKYE
jgi:hypothetical protein